MAYVVVLSLMRTLELEFLQPLPRPILRQKELIPCNKELIQSLHKKLGFLMELLDENRMDGVEAIKRLETKLRDVAFRIEDEIELQVVHLYEEEDDDDDEFRIFEGIIDIFDRIVDQAFQPRENLIYVEMPQVNTGEKSTHHCHRLHQILHPPTGTSHPCLKFRRILHRAVQDIDVITEELVKVNEEYQLFKHQLQGTKQAALLHALPMPTDQLITMTNSSQHASRSKDIIVRKQDEFEIIKEKLIQHPSKQLEVVSIKGMGGIGKTTSARQIYDDPSIISYFDKLAWAVVSQHHNKRQMHFGLLGIKDDEDNNSVEEDLALRLYQSLKCQSYLVVMDDVWSEEAWDAVKTCFPNDGNGSRVLLTTRLVEVVNHTCSKDDFSHQMQFLEQSESWQLFKEKACDSRGAEFETIGRPVVEKCKGLPLAIIVVAGLFSKLNTLDEWKNTANALSSSSASTLDDEECSRILSLSYNHLPHNLKACFLYLGVFPEDHEMNANYLARLWLAEGLVKAFENESFDAAANRADDCSKEYITNFPCLKKVRIEWEGRESNACIANLAYLEQLEGIWISGWHVTHTPINNDIVLLKNLRKLTLNHLGLEWEEINILSKLPRLELLKLKWESCIGKEWKIQEEVIFCHLIALFILDCDLKHWKASSHNFPKLEHLYIWDCDKLREIPIDFAEISTLKSIKLRGCLHSAVESAKKIQEEQCDSGNCNMVVIEEETLDVLESEESPSEDETEVDSC